MKISLVSMAFSMTFFTGCGELSNEETAPTELVTVTTEMLPEVVTDSDFRNDGQFDARQIALGRSLFQDQLLSGNQNISCMTCHNPNTGTSDGFSLGVGEDGIANADSRIPRNAPALFNLGARQFTALFHDGRVSENSNFSSGFETPLGTDLPSGFENVLAAQAVFPMTSDLEMAGDDGENPVGTAAAAGNITGAGGVWEQLTQRIQSSADYVNQFIDAYEHIDQASDIQITDIGNAIATFESSEFRATNSAFDRFLTGRPFALSGAAIRGLNLFYGEANCVRCHSGSLQTDQQFHDINIPQIGPGAGNGFQGLEDFGRENTTGNSNDRYSFRTPSLRNVELTGPYGHDGAYSNLRDMVRHYRNTNGEMLNYDPAIAGPVLPFNQTLSALDFTFITGPDFTAQGRLNTRIRLNDGDIDDIVAFLQSLTSE